MIRHLIASAAFAVCAALSAHADPVTDVISDQLDAFEQADTDRAWAHASPMIQGMFGTPDNFAAMVAQGYPVIWNNEAARFFDRIGKDGRVRQVVVITDANGVTAAFEYDMIQTDAGWKINGVRSVESPELAV